MCVVKNHMQLHGTSSYAHQEDFFNICMKLQISIATIYRFVNLQISFKFWEWSCFRLSCIKFTGSYCTYTHVSGLYRMNYDCGSCVTLLYLRSASLTLLTYACMCCFPQQILVLDEADRILDEGFRNDLDQILEDLPRSRQTLVRVTISNSPWFSTIINNWETWHLCRKKN